jgi:2-oxoglutarate dehydrogenase E1 component
VDVSSLLTGNNAGLIDQIYHQWASDPDSVDPAWAELFSQWEDEEGYAPPVHHPSAPSIFSGNSSSQNVQGGLSRRDAMVVANRQARAAQLINAYRVRGHIEADIDPLDRKERVTHPELTLDFYGLSDADLDAPISGTGVYGVPEQTTLRHIIARLRRAYCASYGVEFMNINDIEKKRWLQKRLETLQDTDPLSSDEERYALRLLADAENFENLLGTLFPGTKRFSVEGAEPLIPLMALMIDEAAEGGIDRILIGMAHRGRLNVLANIFNKPIRAIIEEFRNLEVEVDSVQGSGDVKYHLGYSSEYTTHMGRKVRMTLAFNPSHLEAVNPVVEGRARARQDRRGPGSHANIMPVLIHGDAAFAGQGLVAETLNLSRLRAYKTGGCIHIIINNQIGFTTSPRDARSTPYCSDVARMLAVPIFHVNGEDVEAVASVAKLAAEYRQTFNQDVIIDMYCYRKYGHNEGDEPAFTQPLLYNIIRQKHTPREEFANSIIRRGEMTQEEADAIASDSASRLRRHLDQPVSGERTHDGSESWLKELWENFLTGSIHDEVDTTFERSRLVALLETVNSIPANFNAHRKIKRLVSQRLQAADGKRPVDWAVAEQAAYATLCDQGYRVRISGQDAGRGTFSHRHAVLNDSQNGKEYVPLAHIREGQGPFEVYDSFLSEAAVLGFEYGYSLDAPDALVIWEAQFGDFANGAQVLIDNFIMSTEQKWGRNTGVVMLLPHGYEGQGPEHSSARLERYLQLCAEDNVTVANCTTPASFFHLLRRQVLLKTRKPLVVMSPKSLLRHPLCISTIDDLAQGAFQRVIPDESVDCSTIKRVVFCSGKIYYELLAERVSRGITDIAIARLEQLYPFPGEEVRAFLERCSPDAEVVWCQEEPRNMGAWPMMDEWMGVVLGGMPPQYIGRPESASPATGFHQIHKQEQQQLVNEALSLD